MRNLRNLGAIIHEVLNEPQYNEYKRLEDVKTAWKEVAGDFISSNTSVRDFKNGVLSVFTRATAFVFQLTSMKKQYISEMNRRNPGLSLNDIYFKVGNVSVSERRKTHVEEILESAREDELMFFNIDNIEVPEDADASIRDFVKSLNVEDAELRERILRITQNFYRVTQYKKRNGYIECRVCDFLHDAKTGSAGLCNYCDNRIKNNLGHGRARILEKPYEIFEQHAAVHPDTKFREYAYIKELEISRIKDELVPLIERYVREEDRELFLTIEKNVRTAMSYWESRNYFEVSEFGEKNLQKISDLLGPNVRTVFARGMFLSKL